MASLQESELDDGIAADLSQMLNKKKVEEYEIINRAYRWLTKYPEHQSPLASSLTRPSPCWEPTTGENFKLNVDAACLEGEGTGFGVVVRDKSNSFCFAAVRRTRVQWKPEMAEIKEIWFGIEMAEKWGLIGKRDRDRLSSCCSAGGKGRD
ncbi:unnamed protein product [Linum trigynum]|uniref:RNase H type-1 domain-containing protein n=1 Tax=Linum trigynum TaxID=586398 RepID=A0AAV2CG27_9ROSI